MTMRAVQTIINKVSYTMYLLPATVPVQVDRSSSEHKDRSQRAETSVPRIALCHTTLRRLARECLMRFQSIPLGAEFQT